LCCATSISWSRKNTTQCSFSASRISPTVPSSSSWATSTPKISAPPAPEIGRTSIRLFLMACSYSARMLLASITAFQRACSARIVLLIQRLTAFPFPLPERLHRTAGVT
jgi:hypothetical protein